MTKPKQAGERRGEILDAAETLFSTQGYENTSVNDVLTAVGIAKGTFYHHFASKEAVMDGIIDRQVTAIAASGRRAAEQAAADPALTDEQRLIAVIVAMREQAGTKDEVLSELHRPENIVFHHKSQRRTREVTVPILAGVVRDGIASGAFRTDFPEESLDLILLNSAQLFDQPGRDPQAVHRSAAAFAHHVELLLGARQGAFTFLLPMLTGDDR